ncbi:MULTISPECIES: Mrp/NBP35 family ATP-binding protein [unclassified Moraxella]|uniref:Iron-sulfur cluster carrier protein n=3 Tax=Moraxella TaxID=475 RepID=A0A1B8Q859_MORLA|nr:Mrp/NBP35 family ATP-binding protein [Moraxella sp. K2450]MBE9578155.1 Mrp/NBP35 family ATP-binding protein [Moraxella sp. K1664]MBE9587660.1 Mrp/NBP35 family ATP-binding protein [Moraxella sp. K1630]MDI4482202.1 ATP-binding protein [Moraxella lacunata]MBE9595856.1 Mrp/NBP35 family ATP-binding protein [Moraxella sp. K2450]MDI4506679.1 ATP-binding protein [Moraxella lacunata]
MFNPFKKKIHINMSDIDKVLQDFRLYGQALPTFIDDKSLHDDTLDIALRVHKDADQAELEQVYHDLRARLHLIGVAEVNLNVVLSDKVAPIATTASAVQTHTPQPSNKIPSQTTDDTPTKSAPKQADIAPHPRIRHIIVVASGKGGVGKSTTTVNIALALQKLGKKVGILDADIYGPSVPDMLGVAGVKPTVENDQFVPIDAHGIAMLSIGNLIESENTPVAWRGVKATGALMQLYSQTNWPTLDYLIIDMPPGTGDIQLTLAQRIPVTGAVIVTTPQHIALLDAQKGMEMFFKTDIPVIGVVENMALHTCTNCGHVDAIFGADGGAKLAERYQVPLLGQLPLATDIRTQMDKGEPSVMAGDDFAVYYENIAKNIDGQIGKFDKGASGRIF